MIYYAAISSMTLLGLFGFSINLYIFVKLRGKIQESSEFTKLCMAKTIPNILVCSSFLFWCIPLSILQLPVYQIPFSANVLIGQTIGYGAYLSGPCIQLLLAVNRWFSLCFPFRRCPGNGATLISLAFVILIASIYTLLGFFPMTCGFFYDPLIYLWIGDANECAIQNERMIARTVICVSVCSNVFNLTTSVKLCWDKKVGGLSDEAMLKRRKLRIRLFIQCVTQDCLHLIDVVNWNVISYWSNEVYFQFIFVTMSLLTIHALDGLVMFYFHSEIYPKSLQRSKSVVATLTI